MIKHCFCSEQDPRAVELREKMRDFYANKSDYRAYQTINHKPEFWDPIVERIRAKVCQHERCDVLEFGAGRTGFGAYLGDLRDKVHLSVQDITPQNRDFLDQQSDATYIIPIVEVRGKYDIIFSTFVWEHLTNPRAVLKHLLGLLTPGGSMFIASPRYDLPFYLCPSIKHYPRWKRFWIGLWTLQRRMRVLARGEPDFLIHLHPAVFHRPWFRDADAVHIVSIFDLRRSLIAGYTMRQIRLVPQGFRHWIYSRFLLMFVEIVKPESMTDHTSVQGGSLH